LSGEKIEPAQAHVHRFRVPSQDGREISVLVNYSEKDAARELSVPCAAGAVTLSSQARMSGVVVIQGQKAQPSKVPPTCM
jgi:hypothetical protein